MRAILAERMTKTLVVTNDFPPRPGGIQAFVHELARRLPPDSVVVYAPRGRAPRRSTPRSRSPSSGTPPALMLPMPTVARRAAALLRAHECDSVCVRRGSAPGAARRHRCARPGAAPHRRAHARPRGGLGRPAGRRGGCCAASATRVDVLTYLGDYTRRRIAAALSPAAAARHARG